MEVIKNIINQDNEILGGQLVFSGTRVPVETLFFHLEKGISLNEFLDDFPTVSREQVVSLLEIVKKIFTSKNIDIIYEITS